MCISYITYVSFSEYETCAYVFDGAHLHHGNEKFVKPFNDS